MDKSSACRMCCTQCLPLLQRTQQQHLSTAHTAYEKQSQAPALCPPAAPPSQASPVLSQGQRLRGPDAGVGAGAAMGAQHRRQHLSEQPGQQQPVAQESAQPGRAVWPPVGRHVACRACSRAQPAAGAELLSDQGLTARAPADADGGVCWGGSSAAHRYAHTPTQLSRAPAADKERCRQCLLLTCSLQMLTTGCAGGSCTS
jgi:hypothetical protein